MIPEKPYFLCIFRNNGGNKENLKSYSHILQLRFETNQYLRIEKVVYAAGEKTLHSYYKNYFRCSKGQHEVCEYYTCKKAIDFTDANICGQLEQAQLETEKYLCMEIVEHLFAPYTPPQGTVSYVVKYSYTDSIKDAYLVAEVEHKYLTTFTIRKVWLNKYEWNFLKICEGEIEIFYPNQECLGFAQLNLQNQIIGFLYGYSAILLSEQEFSSVKETLFPLSTFLHDRIDRLYQYLEYEEYEEKLLEAGITLESLEILDRVVEALIP